MSEDPRVIASATWQHFKPGLIILAVLVAACGPALFFHGAAFWGVMAAWWIFLITALVVADKLWHRRPRESRKP